MIITNERHKRIVGNRLINCCIQKNCIPLVLISGTDNNDIEIITELLYDQKELKAFLLEIVKRLDNGDRLTQLKKD